MSEIQPDDIVLVADVYLGDWAHSVHSAKRTTDAKATFFFPSDDEMRPLTAHQTRVGQGKREAGKRFRLFLVEARDDAGESDDDLPPAAPDYGYYARDLKLSGFCRAPAVWAVVGSDADFRDWVSYQPSILSGRFTGVDDQGNQRNVACHVRRSSNSGIAHKPDYACVPMTDEEHQIQHRRGECAVYQMRHAVGGARGISGGVGSTSVAQWFDEQRIATVERWVWESIKKRLGVTSMRDADPDAIAEWAAAEGIERYLPSSFQHED